MLQKSQPLKGKGPRGEARHPSPAAPSAERAGTAATGFCRPLALFTGAGNFPLQSPSCTVSTEIRVDSMINLCAFRWSVKKISVLYVFTYLDLENSIDRDRPPVHPVLYTKCYCCSLQQASNNFVFIWTNQCVETAAKNRNAAVSYQVFVPLP